MAPGSPNATIAVPTFPPALLYELLAVSLTGVNVLRPVYGPAGEIADFSIEYLNPAGQRMTGLEEQPGGMLLTRFPHVIAAGVLDYYRRVFAEGASGLHEFNYQADGLDNYFRLAARRSGEWLLVSFTDTADQDRSQVEQALRESQAREQQARAEAEQQRALAEAAQREAEAQRRRLHDFMSAAPGVVLSLVGPQHVIEFANAGFRQQFGVPDPVGKPYLEILPEATDQFAAAYQATAFYDHIYRTGEPYYAAEAPYYVDPTHSGQRELRYFSFAVQAARDGTGRIAGVQAYASDVTEQVLARHQVEHLNQELESRVQRRTRQLSEQQALLSRILGQVPAAIATVSGPDHRFMFFNELYQTLSEGRTELSQAVADVFPEVAEQGFISLLDQVYATGEPFKGTEVSTQMLNPATGQRRQYYLDFIYQPLFDAQQQVQGILIFALDVTDRVQARQSVEASQLQVQELNQELAVINEELRATNEELQRSNACLTRTNVDLDTFVYTASHDLKAPITNIEGILNALRDTLPAEVQQDPVVDHLMGLLDHTVERFRLTIHQLTDLSRLQQTYNEPVEQLLLSPIVANVLADLAPAITAAAAQVYLEVPPDLQVSFAPASLRSVVYNLLSNAIKYCSPERPANIWLRAEQQVDTVVLTVRDNGLGLTDSQQTRLFGVFQRLHTHVEGTGVGLYMIKRLIENAGATITVTSVPAVGSTFTVTFPAPL